MKLSSRVRRWTREFLTAVRDNDATKQQSLMASLTAPDLPAVVAVMDEGKTAEEWDVLYRLANLNDGQVAYFQKHCAFGLAGETDETLIQMRDELREIWGTERPGEIARRDEFIGKWFGADGALVDGKWQLPADKWVMLWQFGIMRPAFFSGELAWAFCRHHARLAICGNPDCPAPYFVAKRRSQKYCCANDLCTQYAGRLAANKYWNSPKRKQRSKRGK